MNIVVGSGKNRRSFTVGHRATMTRTDRAKIVEDVKAFVVRPATFVGHSSSNRSASR